VKDGSQAPGKSVVETLKNQHGNERNRESEEGQRGGKSQRLSHLFGAHAHEYATYVDILQFFFQILLISAKHRIEIGLKNIIRDWLDKPFHVFDWLDKSFHDVV
jgi:hypothetical protein